MFEDSYWEARKGGSSRRNLIADSRRTLMLLQQVFGQVSDISEFVDTVTDAAWLDRSEAVPSQEKPVTFGITR